MAFVTSVIGQAHGRRILTLKCYNSSAAVCPDERLTSHDVKYVLDPDERLTSHDVKYVLDPGEKRPGVDEIWQKDGWGKRGGRLPICPDHRKPGDEDWPSE